MRRPFVLLPLAAGFSCALVAQTLTPQVVANGGGFDQGTNLSLEWTLGQLASESIALPAGMLTQGFHQPILLFVARGYTPEDSRSEPTVTVFPNPLTAEMNVRVEGAGSDRYTALQLMDATGKLVAERLDVDLEAGFRWGIADLPSGTYHLRIAQSNGDNPYSFTVIKIK